MKARVNCTLPVESELCINNKSLHHVFRLDLLSIEEEDWLEKDQRQRSWVTPELAL